MPIIQPGLDLEYCQRWSRGQHSWRHTSEGGFDPRQYEVTPCPESVAKQFALTHHYSHSFPATRRCYGLYDSRGQLNGIAVLSTPTNAATLSNIFPGRTGRETAELGRFVLLDKVPAPAESWTLARVLALAATDGIHGIVAFSDPVPRTTIDGRTIFPGHIGHIYKASNAHYCGRSRPRTLHLLPDGSVLSDRAIAKILAQDQGHAYAEATLVKYGAEPLRDESPRTWLPRALKAARIRQLYHTGNHRFAFITKPKRRYWTLGLPTLAHPSRVP